MQELSLLKMTTKFPGVSVRLFIYRNNPKYWDRQAGTNSVDQDQMLQNVVSDLSYSVCHLSNSF